MLLGGKLGSLSLLLESGWVLWTWQAECFSGAGRAEQWVLCCLLGPCQGIQLGQRSSYGAWAPGPRPWVTVWAERAPVFRPVGTISSHRDKQSGCSNHLIRTVCGQSQDEGRDSAQCPWSGKGQFPLEPGSLLLVPEVVPGAERWSRVGRTVESLLPDGWVQNCDQYLAEISLSNSSGICFLVYGDGVERDIKHILAFHIFQIVCWALHVHFVS